MRRDGAEVEHHAQRSQRRIGALPAQYVTRHATGVLRRNLFDFRRRHRRLLAVGRRHEAGLQGRQVGAGRLDEVSHNDLVKLMVGRDVTQAFPKLPAEIGEVARTGVHGANRLGGNSLIELLVYGRITGAEAAEYASSLSHVTRSPEAIAELKTFLESADMVKFAGVEATPEMADAATGKAKAYLEADPALAKAAAEKLIKQLADKGLKVATRVEPAGKFWRAETYHQNYYFMQGKKPYCHRPVKRFE